MLVLACSAIVGLLVGQASGEMWVNEIYTKAGAYHSAFVEVIGRPEETSGGDKPNYMKGAVEFYSPSGEKIRTASGYLMSTRTWNYNYGVELFTTYARASFPDTNEIAGLALVDGDERKIYCWGVGSGAKGASIGNKPELQCDVSVRDGPMGSSDGTVRAVGLYGGQAVGGGTKESDFAWAVSSDGFEEFHTMGSPNTCPAEPRHCNLKDQALAKWLFEDVSQVWLNEVDVLNEGGVPRVTVEVLGRPSASPAPADMTVAMTFYKMGAQQGETQMVALTPNERFGTYAGFKKVIGAEGAFDAQTIVSGVVLTYEGVDVVYCWGENAGKFYYFIGDYHQCGRVVRLSPFGEAAEGDRENSALFNGPNSPSGGGAKESDWVWEESAVEGHVFSTIGQANQCPPGSAPHCKLEGQVISPPAEGWNEAMGDEESLPPATEESGKNEDGQGVVVPPVSVAPPATEESDKNEDGQGVVVPPVSVAPPATEESDKNEDGQGVAVPPVSVAPPATEESGKNDEDGESVAPVSAEPPVAEDGDTKDDVGSVTPVQGGSDVGVEASGAVVQKAVGLTALSFALVACFF